MTDNISILNLPAINELKEILEDDVFEIYTEFKTGSGNMINELKKSYESGDSESVLHLSHTIKGSSGNIGLQKIYTLSHELEQGLRENTNPDVASLIIKIESAYTESISELITLGLLPE